MLKYSSNHGQVKPLPWLPAPHDCETFDPIFVCFPEAALISVAKKSKLCNKDDDVEDTLLKKFFFSWINEMFNR